MKERILCPKCDGSGIFVTRGYPIGEQKECPLCRGKLVVYREVTYIALEEK